MSFEPASMHAPTAQETFTPTGTQSRAMLYRRRALFWALVTLTVIGLGAWLAAVLRPAGFGPIEILMLVAFLANAPWIAVGFWNAAIGVVVLHLARDPLAAVIPAALKARPTDPVTVRTAVFMTLRNEDSARAFARLKAIKASVDATGFGDQFDYFVLSDSSQPEAIAAEAREFAALKREIPGEGRLVYRRRSDNAGFKAGNVRDFCERWGRNYELMVPLDADSLMTGDAIVRLVRIMQANPRLGLLQSLVVGLPSTSLFTRFFQFGMRHAMRAYTAGSAWWQADCGPYWGHNAAIRVAPFTEHCRLPDLPGGPPLGGHILSHDQIEAVLLRRAGHEVRVLPEEGGSYEENPPALPDFARRDLRWCQGNMQYVKLVDMPGIEPTSRMQIALAIQMFVGSAGLVIFVALAAIAAARWPRDVAFPLASAAGLYVVWILLYLAPKLFGLIDALVGSARRYGGAARLVAGGLVETVFNFLLVPIQMFGDTVLMFGLLFGRTVIWEAQRRDGYSVTWREAFAHLWPHTLFGVALLAVLAYGAPGAILWFLPFAAGLALAVPVAVVTSEAALGLAAARRKICAIPEEFEAPPEVAALFGRGPATPPVSEWFDRLVTWAGVVRSLHIYYGGRARHRTMDALHARFLRTGDLAFDVGAHVGDRVASFRRLGARVVAVEPQPALVRALQFFYGRDPSVAIEAFALGAKPGTVELRLNLRNPTVSTASDAFVAAAAGAPGWENQAWSRAVSVPVTTLDALIARYGEPRFVKIDVEGFEDEVIAGLSRPLPALSLEFTTIQRDIALAAIARLARLGPYVFNATIGESQRFVHAAPLSAADIAHWLDALPIETNSGDIYSALDSRTLEADPPATAAK
jgi:membrane glycosyltransferase